MTGWERPQDQDRRRTEAARPGPDRPTGLVDDERWALSREYDALRVEHDRLAHLVAETDDHLAAVAARLGQLEAARRPVPTAAGPLRPPPAGAAAPPPPFAPPRVARPPTPFAPPREALPPPPFAPPGGTVPPPPFAPTSPPGARPRPAPPLRTPGPAAPAGPAGPAAPPPARREWRPATVGNLLLGLGTLLLTVAALIFATVAWPSLDELQRALVLLGVTAISGAGTAVLHRRLRRTSEAFSLLLIAFLLVDWYAVRRAGLGVSVQEAWWWTIGTASVALAAAALASFARFRSQQLVTVALGTTAAVCAVSGLGADLPERTGIVVAALALAAVAAVEAGLAALTHRRTRHPADGRETGRDPVRWTLAAPALAVAAALVDGLALLFVIDVGIEHGAGLLTALALAATGLAPATARLLLHRSTITEAATVASSVFTPDAPMVVPPTAAPAPVPAHAPTPGEDLLVVAAVAALLGGTVVAASAVWDGWATFAVLAAAGLAALAVARLLPRIVSVGTAVPALAALAAAALSATVPVVMLVASPWASTVEPWHGTAATSIDAALLHAGWVLSSDRPMVSGGWLPIVLSCLTVAALLLAVPVGRQRRWLGPRTGTTLLAAGVALVGLSAIAAVEGTTVAAAVLVLLVLTTAMLAVGWLADRRAAAHPTAATLGLPDSTALTVVSLATLVAALGWASVGSWLTVATLAVAAALLGVAALGRARPVEAAVLASSAWAALIAAASLALLAASQPPAWAGVLAAVAGAGLLVVTLATLAPTTPLRRGLAVVAVGALGLGLPLACAGWFTDTPWATVVAVAVAAALVATLASRLDPAMPRSTGRAVAYGASETLAVLAVVLTALAAGVPLASATLLAAGAGTAAVLVARALPVLATLGTAATADDRGTDDRATHDRTPDERTPDERTTDQRGTHAGGAVDPLGWRARVTAVGPALGDATIAGVIPGAVLLAVLLPAASIDHAWAELGTLALLAVSLLASAGIAVRSLRPALVVAGTAAAALTAVLVPVVADAPLATAGLVAAVAAGALLLGATWLPVAARDRWATEGVAIATASMAPVLTAGDPGRLAEVLAVLTAALAVAGARPVRRTCPAGEPALELAPELATELAPELAVEALERSIERWAAGVGALLTMWACLWATDVVLIEAYTVPAALAALAAGIAVLRRHPEHSSWLLLGPALVLGFVPSTLIVLGSASGTDGVRALVLMLAAAVAVGLGAWRRLQAPAVVGGMVLLVLSVDLLWPVAARIPRWAVLAVLGTVFVWLGATIEHRLRQARHMKDVVGHLH